MKVPDLLEIAVAWKRSMRPTKSQWDTANARLMICAGCPANTYVEHIKTYICGDCQCPLNRKVYSPNGRSACPRNQWPV